MSSCEDILLHKLDVNGNNVGERGHQSIGNKTGNHHLNNVVNIPRSSWTKLITIIGFITVLLATAIGVILGVLHTGKSSSSSTTTSGSQSYASPSYIPPDSYSSSPVPSTSSSISSSSTISSPVSYISPTSSLPTSSLLSSPSTAQAISSDAQTPSASPTSTQLNTPPTPQAISINSQTPAASTTHMITQFETITPTSAPKLSPGASCTANDQCIAPNVCYTTAATTTCCGTSIPGCPGAPCNGFDDCKDPYGCVTEAKTCCGWGSTTVLAGSTCYAGN